MSVIKASFDVGESIYPDHARRMVAELMDGQQPALIASLMNYIPGTGTSSNDFPLVQFSGARNGFSLLGFGGAGAAIVEDALPLIHAALARRHGDRIIKVDHAQLNVSVEPRPYGLRYTVPRMVVQKKQRHAQWLQGEAEGKAFLEGLFLRSLQRQAEAVGVTLPGDIQVKFLGAEGQFACKQNDKAPVAHMGLRKAVFEVNARLGGIWSVGYMLSKGYGQFNATYQLSGAQHAVSE